MRISTWVERFHFECYNYNRIIYFLQHLANFPYTYTRLSYFGLSICHRFSVVIGFLYTLISCLLTTFWCDLHLAFAFFCCRLAYQVFLHDVYKKKYLPLDFSTKQLCHYHQWEAITKFSLNLCATITIYLSFSLVFTQFSRSAKSSHIFFGKCKQLHLL